MRLNAAPQPAHVRARVPSRNLVLLLAAAAVLAGCGSNSGGGQAAQSGTNTLARKPLNPANELSRNMVSAVAANKPSTVPVQVKFELRGRPEAGQPVDLDLAIVPISASVDRVSGKLEGEDGLELVEGAEIAASEHPAEGVPIRHSVKVLPRREGIFTVRAALTVDAAGVASSEAYSIPLIAATAAAEDSGAPGSAGAPAPVSGAHTTSPATAAAQ